MIGYTADKIVEMVESGTIRYIDIYVRETQKNYDYRVRRLGYKYNYSEERKEELRREANEAEDAYLVMIKVLKKLDRQNLYRLHTKKFKEIYIKRMELY